MEQDHLFLTKLADLQITENIENEYTDISYSLKIQGSPVNKNTNTIINSYLNYNLLSDIQTEFGYTTTGWVKNTYSVNVDSGSATIDIKVGYLSGAYPSGFFDYNVYHEADFLSDQENWKIDGEFKCFGPLDFKKKQLALFKSANGSNSWRPYLTGLIVNSSLYGVHHNISKLFSPNLKVDVNEDLNLANLKLSLSMDVGYEPTGLSDIKYTIEASPSKWIYELLPSATIEGSYVIQNLQMKSQSRQKFSMDSDCSDKTYALNTLNGYLKSFASGYVNTGSSTNVKAFLIEEEVTTGVYSANSYNVWLGADNNITTGLLSLQSVGSINDKVSVRAQGYNFGY